MVLIFSSNSQQISKEAYFQKYLTISKGQRFRRRGWHHIGKNREPRHTPPFGGRHQQCKNEEITKERLARTFECAGKMNCRWFIDSGPLHRRVDDIVGLLHWTAGCVVSVGSRDLVLLRTGLPSGALFHLGIMLDILTKSTGLVNMSSKGNLHSADYQTDSPFLWCHSLSPCPFSPAVFLVPHVSSTPFSIHPPEVLRLSLLFPSPDTHLLTCLHFPHQPHSIYTAPLPLFQCQFIVLSCTQLCSFEPVPTCLLPAILSDTSYPSTCLPVCLPVPANLPVSHLIKINNWTASALPPHLSLGAAFSWNVTAWTDQPWTQQKDNFPRSCTSLLMLCIHGLMRRSSNSEYRMAVLTMSRREVSSKLWLKTMLTKWALDFINTHASQSAPQPASLQSALL